MVEPFRVSRMAKISVLVIDSTFVVAQVEFFFYNGKDELQPVELSAFLVKKALTAEEELPRVECLAVQLLEETTADLGSRHRTLSTLPTLASVTRNVLSVLVED